MNSAKQNTRSVYFHFKQWSRKGYAMFNSLGRVIHIASLSVSVSQGIGQMIMYVDTHLFQALQDEYEDDDITVSDEELLALQLVTKSTDKYKPELIKTIYKLPLLRVTL